MKLYSVSWLLPSKLCSPLWPLVGFLVSFGDSDRRRKRYFQNTNSTFCKKNCFLIKKIMSIPCSQWNADAWNHKCIFFSRVSTLFRPLLSSLCFYITNSLKKLPFRLILVSNFVFSCLWNFTWEGFSVDF